MSKRYSVGPKREDHPAGDVPGSEGGGSMSLGLGIMVAEHKQATLYAEDDSCASKLLNPPYAWHATSVTCVLFPFPIRLRPSANSRATPNDSEMHAYPGQYPLPRHRLRT